MPATARDSGDGRALKRAMRRLGPVALFSLLLLAASEMAPAVAQASCTKRLVFVHYSIRVAKTDDAGRVACQGRSRKRYELGSARLFNAAGRYLTYVADGEHGGTRVVRLDIRSGEKLLLDHGGADFSATFLRAWAIGHVAWSTVVDGDHRLRLWDEERDQVRTVLAGAALDPATFAVSDDLTAYWTQEDGTPGATGDPYAPVGPPHHGFPAYQRTDRPLCKQNVIFLRGAVRVVRTSGTTMAACGPGGVRHPLGIARDFVAAGPWLVYADEEDGAFDLLQLNVRTGERRHLKRPGGFNAFLDGLLPDGTVAWTDLDFPEDGVHRAIRLWPAGAAEPVTVEESFAARDDPDAAGLEPGVAALARDGTLYWRDEHDVLHSRLP